MPKVWLIAQHHFWKEARSRTFVLLLFALPLFMAFAAGMGVLFSHVHRSHVTLGYVDPAGFVADPGAGPQEPDLTLVRFEGQADAHRALEAGEIDAYYVLPESGEARRTELIYFEPPNYAAVRAFQDLVRRNRMAGQPAALVERVIAGADVTVRATDSNREFPGGDPTVTHALPVLAAIIFSFLVMTTFGYLGEAVVTEKENRTVEVLMTSTSAGRMMAGKILGGLAIALLQLLVWIGSLVLIVLVGGTVLDVQWLQNIDPNWRDIGLVVLVALPTYLFLAALTTAVGATMVETQEIQQLGGLAFFLLFLPIYLLVPLSQAPNGPLALVFSLLPFTSVTTIALRCLLVEVPAWQAAAAAALSLVSGLLMVWVAGKAFRASMLRYGKRASRRRLLGRRRDDAARSTAGS